MWKIFIIMFALWIAACSNTQVHVYTSGIDQYTQQQLLQSLKIAGLNAHQQTTPLPPLIAEQKVINQSEASDPMAASLKRNSSPHLK